MERGYVKLWRSIEHNELLENDNTAFIVFTKLLTRVNRLNGTYTTGRNRLASVCNINPNTLYSALKRLEASTIIQLHSNSASTTITICNWWKYQQDDNSASTARRRAINTKQEREKEREYIDTNVSTAIVIAKTPSTDINDMFEEWERSVGYRIDGQKQKNRFACSNLLKKYGKDGLTQMIRGVSLAQQDKYAPSVADFCSLQAKQNDLIAWGKKQKTTTLKKVVAV